ncbi:hypothetical protein [Bacillus atrophaeus]|uniref:hypothetical protein n=1 Tax=Bacillus atrophaeus TaxID=1452 RepID=UPI00227F7884|nr:hypothetical protein [Bacillus atrophaeus]MCY8988142.1 hypothetical protein [Bacillus atrophaeus]
MNLVLSLWDWLLDNSGSFGMFVLTIFIAYYSKKSSKASFEAAQLAKKEYDRLRQPEMIIYFELKEFSLYFKLKNIGSGVATNVTIDIEDEMGSFSNSYISKMDKGLLNTRIMTIAPNQEISGLAALISDIKEGSNYPVFKCNIKYSDSKGKTLFNSYNFDLSYIGGLVWTKETTLKDIAKHLKGIDEGIKKIPNKIS